MFLELVLGPELTNANCRVPAPASLNALETLMVPSGLADAEEPKRATVMDAPARP
ncbi:hypothetical protein D3C78_1848730 [compost metagenome]